jgi:type VI secretion system secreted protein VgrG
MRIDTPLEADLLLLEGFEAEEGLSRPYLYTLELLSEDPDIKPEDLLWKKVLVSMDSHPEEPPVLTHGVIRSFVRLGRAEGLARYRAEMVPAFWFLTQTVDCRIFQNESVIDIVTTLLDEGASAGKVKHESRCQRSYAKREFCVQYRESNFNFISRLLEEEGIFYFFEHSKDDEKLVLADGHKTFKPCPDYEKIRCRPEGTPDEQAIFSLVEEHTVRSYEVELQDYDPLQPSMKLYGTVKGTESKIDAVFDYPGLFTEIDAGEYRARLDLERREKSRHRVSGTSSAHGLRAGTVVEIEEHFRDATNAKYYLDRVRHSAHSGAFRAWDQAAFHYSNEFTAFPENVPFRADRNARQPYVRGTQTAVVVGKKGEEVWVDEHGRVKVQFHWDRKGKNDENSSCWIRVSTQTAGKNWGHIEIPRIGHEVLVDFLEGNPDRPIIVGSVYNADMKTPYPLPEKGVVSGIKTKSSPKASGYNELIMDDKAGKELIRMHAQKDLDTTVLNDETRAVKHDQTLTVTNDQTITVEEGNQTTTIGKGNQSNTVDVGDQTNVVKKGKQTITVEKDRRITVKQGDQKTTVKLGDITVKASAGKITIDGMKEILLKCGPSSIKLSPKGIEIKGPTLKAEGQTTAELKGGMTMKVEGGMMAEFKGGMMAKVQGGAMAQIQGGIVKIN